MSVAKLHLRQFRIHQELEY